MYCLHIIIKTCKSSIINMLGFLNITGEGNKYNIFSGWNLVQYVLFLMAYQLKKLEHFQLNLQLLRCYGGILCMLFKFCIVFLPSYCSDFMYQCNPENVCIR